MGTPTCTFAKENITNPLEHFPSFSMGTQEVSGNKFLSFIPLTVALVRDILEQITANDAPAGNEVLTMKDGINQDILKPSTVWPIVAKNGLAEMKIAEIQGATSLDTDMTETNSTVVNSSNLNNPSDQYELFTQETFSQQALLKMGHKDLAALCVSTLQTVDLGTTLQPKLCGNAADMSKQTITNLNNKRNFRTSPTKRNKFTLPWSRSNGAAARTNCDEEKKEEETTSQARLQLFGSEYARHLSTCQLAPSIVNKHVKSVRRKQYIRNRCVHLEDAKLAIQTGALLDILVTSNDEPPPNGYYRISQTGSGKSASFGGPLAMYLNVKKEAVWDKAAQRPCVTALTLIFPDRQEFVPPGFSIVRLARDGQPANLNQSFPGAERVYLCIRRSREGNPITGILPLVPSHGDVIPAGYTVIEHTPRNLTATVTAATGEAIFLAYRQRLANLELLRPLFLTETIMHSLHDPYLRQTRPTLSAYFCTGATTVESDIGRFHILDRSTHSLLSPSSIANRMNLIEMSRRKSIDDTGNDIPVTPLTYARSDCGDSDTGSNGSYSSIGREIRKEAHRSKGGGSLADLPIQENVYGNEINDYASECSNSLKEENDDEDTANLSSLLSSTHENLGDEVTVTQRMLKAAMSFIPEIESVNYGENDAAKLKLRIELITPILTACYIRHGGAALLAVEGLTRLLTTANFFLDDINHSVEGKSGCYTRITLLDLAIQAVSDVATSGSQEAVFASCLEFIERAVSLAQGQLNPRTIGYVFRFYLFIFYFDASIPRKISDKIPSIAWRPLAMYNEEDFPMLYDPRNDGSKCGYLAGGAPQAASLALKDLISFSIERLGRVSVTNNLLVEMCSVDDQIEADCNFKTQEMYRPVLRGILSSIIDNSVELVERANYTQLALHQIHRSGGSELFWHDMIYECGNGLFGNDKNLTGVGKEMLILLFAMLQQLVKVSAGKLRPPSDDAELLPKDIASKLLSLELLLHFLEFWSDEREALKSISSSGEIETMKSINTLMYTVRRTVVPCLLWNTKPGLENPQIYRRVIRLVSELWCSPVYRKHCKVELGILMEHFALKILELGPQCQYTNIGAIGIKSLLSQQIELIGEIKNWLSSDPKDVIEMYLNYDTDITEEVTGQFHFLPGTRWQIFQRLCAGLSGIAERCGEMIGNQILQNQSIILSMTDKSHHLSSRDEAKRDAIEKADLREAARVLRKASLDAISQIVKSLAISAGAASGIDLMNLLMSWSPSEFPISYESMLLTKSATTSSSCEYEKPVKQRQLHLSSSDGDDGVIKFWRSAIGIEQAKRFAGSIPNHSESLETAFVIIEQKSLKKSIEYLIACNILTPAPRDIANFLRIHKDRINPVSLGQYLGENGTGGSESEYWNSIRYLFVRAISFIGMNVEEGLRQFLTGSGFRLPGEAQQIDRLLSTFAQCFFEDNAGDTQRCPFKDQDTIYLIVFAIIMLNTDLHKVDTTSRKTMKKMTKVEFINNLRGAAVNEGVAKEYLSMIYDSIELNPIALHITPDKAAKAKESQDQSLENILKNVGVADSLLRGLAVHDFKFATIDDFVDCLEYPDQHALSDLTRSCVAKTWHQWHGALNTCLENAHLDPQGMEPAIDILLYALAVTVCLNMPMERSAFLGQLVRLRAFEERRQGRWVSPPDNNSHREEQWYVELEEASSGCNEQKLWALSKIYDWVQSLKAALRVDVRFKVEMTEAVAELVDADFLLQDPARAFLQSGNLLKKSGRTGRTTMYRFYLFSDVLLYASKTSDGRYKIHEELPAHLMKIVDWFPPSQKNRKIMFEVHHPRKTFQVICFSEESRKSWVENIRAAILVEMERKMVMEAARLSVSTEKREKLNK